MPPIFLRARRRGFTVVEVTLVVLLALVLGSIAVTMIGRRGAEASVAVLRADADRYRVAQQLRHDEGGRFAATPAELPGFAASPRVTPLAAAAYGRGYLVALAHPGTDDVCTLVAPDGQGGTKAVIISGIAVSAAP